MEMLLKKYKTPIVLALAVMFVMFLLWLYPGPFIPKSCTGYSFVKSLDKLVTSNAEATVEIKEYLQGSGNRYFATLAESIEPELVELKVIQIRGPQTEPKELKAWVFKDEVAVDSDGIIYSKIYCG